jgi:2-methylcitrate dehydratase PrpD
MTTRDLIAAVHELRADQFDAATVAAIRTLVLDHLGVGINGSTTDTSVVMRANARWFDGEGARFPILGTNDDAPAVRAAMINALAAHAIEYDDVHNASSSHPGVAVIPAVMAAAVLVGADDAAVMRGIAVGYEVMCRVGRAANPPSHYARNFHPTGTSGSLGAAAGAAAVMGLSVDQMNFAVGIAGSMASGSMQFLVDGAWTKRLHPALAVRNGVEAALLAADGFIGTADSITGTKGFLAGYSNAARPELLMAEWGSRPLEVVNTSIKAHTCCRYNQGPIDAVLQLRSAHGLSHDDVESVLVGVPSVAVEIVTEPVSTKRRPKSVVDAQFSLPFGVAVGLVHGRAGLGEYTDQVTRDAAVQESMDRVNYVVDPDIDAAYPEQWKAWAVVETKDGRTLRADIPEPKGDPGNPLTYPELVAKFLSLCDGVIPEVQANTVVSAVEHLGEPGSFSTLVRALS